MIKRNNQRHSFHLVDQSPLLIILFFSALMLTLGFTIFMNSYFGSGILIFTSLQGFDFVTAPFMTSDAVYNSFFHFFGINLICFKHIKVQKMQKRNSGSGVKKLVIQLITNKATGTKTALETLHE